MPRRQPAARARRTALACACVLLLAAAAGCRQPPSQREELLVFGTPASIEIRAAEPAQARAAIAAVAARLSRLGREWHPWQPGALQSLNAAFAAGEPAHAPPSLQALVERARHWHALSDGLFDPAVGGLVALWGFHTSDYPVTGPAPDRAAIDAWMAARPALDDLEVLPDGRLRSGNPRLQLDFNAIAEGAAAAAAAEVLGAHGIAHALLVLGGDVFALGSADGRAWQVAIRDPRTPEHGGNGHGVLAGVALAGREALFTSGSYHKYREAPDGARWPHTLDPRSGLPVTGTAAVSVLHPDPVRADVAATALLVGGAARFAELVERLGTPCALLLTDDDTLLLTAPMHARITLHRQPRQQPPPIATRADCAG